MPYVAWELRCIEEGVANLDIELKRYQLPKEGEEKPNRLMYISLYQGSNSRSLTTQ